MSTRFRQTTPNVGLHGRRNALRSGKWPGVRGRNRLGILFLFVLFAVLAPGWSRDSLCPACAMAAEQQPPMHSGILMIEADEPVPVTRSIRIGVDKSVLVELPHALENVLVANPDVLDAVAQTQNRVYLIARKTGHSNALFVGKGGQQLLALEVTIEYDHSVLRAMLDRMFPGTDIVVEAANDNIVLRGRVHKASEAARIAEIASGFLPAEKKLINMLEVSGREQVMLKVTVAEMKRDMVKRLGINWSGTNIGPSGAIRGATNNSFPVTGSQGFNSFLFGVIGDAAGLTRCVLPASGANIVPPAALASADPASCLAQNLEAFERSGLVRTLAEPQLTAISGETASFLAGGEFPIPVAQSSSVGGATSISVEWKPFGVGLTFTPVVQSEAQISMRIAAEVSELTNEGAVQTGGITLPGLTLRRTSTTVELPSGGSLVMAGLLSNDTKQNFDGVPGLKNLPIIGALFRSRDFQKSETELVVIVSPLIVQPVARSALARPDDNFQPDTDLKAYLLGSLNRRYGSNDTLPPGAYHGDYGFILK